MLDGQKIVVVMPAYNAARTLQRTYDEVVAQGIVALVIVVDDASSGDCAYTERVRVEVHPKIAATTQIKKPVIASHWPRMRTLSL
jgi:glycosyl transferase family 2